MDCAKKYQSLSVPHSERLRGGEREHFELCFRQEAVVPASGESFVCDADFRCLFVFRFRFSPEF